MQRYEGQYLGETPNITVLGSSKVGNFIITIPMLRAIRRKYPRCRIDFWGSELTRDFEENLKDSVNQNIIDWRILDIIRK